MRIKVTVYRLIVLAFSLVIVAQVMGADPHDSARPDSPVGLVVALDCSGSCRGDFPEVLDKVDGLLEALPDSARVALVRFDETAEEIARTSHLTDQQRQTIRERARALRANGRWTHFDLAADQIRISAGALGEPLLAVVFTDAVSDPSAGGEFQQCDQILSDKLSVLRGVNILIIVPDESVEKELIEGGRVHTCLLSAATPETILSFAARAEEESQSVRCPPTPLVIGAMTAVVIVTSLFFFVLLGELKRARQFAKASIPDELERTIQFELVARVAETTFDLGPIEDIEEVLIGTTPRCDVQVVLPDDHEGEFLLKKHDGRFGLENLCDFPVRIERTEVGPGEGIVLAFPATISFGVGSPVVLTLRAVKEPVEDEEQVEASTPKEADNGKAS